MKNKVKLKVEDELLTVNEICLELKLNNSNRGYIQHKYGNKFFTKNEWVKVLKKDGLTY